MRASGAEGTRDVVACARDRAARGHEALRRARGRGWALAHRAAGRVPRPARRLRQRQDDDAQDDQPPGRAGRRQRLRRAARTRASSRRTCSAGGIGYAFQQVGLFPHLTGRRERRRDARAPRLGRGAHPRARRRAARAGRAPARRVPRAPAAGALRRAAAARRPRARARGAEPEILLLDEPFGALDPATRDRLQQSFRASGAELGLTVVFVTHDMAEALLLGDRIAVLREGRLVQLGTPARAAAPPRRRVRRASSSRRRAARPRSSTRCSRAPPRVSEQLALLPG